MTIPSVSAVVGAGTMGPGIAAVLARSGSKVRLNDVSPEVLQRAEAATELASSVLDRVGAPSQPGGSVSFEADLKAALSGADLVLEAVPEKLEVKREVFASLEEYSAPDTILATNTSGIPITQIAKDAKHPGRVIGMHWSNPPHLIPMIEVVPGERTDDSVRDALIAIIKAFGYEAVT